MEVTNKNGHIFVIADKGNRVGLSDHSVYGRGLTLGKFVSLDDVIEKDENYWLDYEESKGIVLSRVQRFFRGENVTVYCDNYVRSVAEIILEHYDNEDYRGTLFLMWPRFEPSCREVKYRKFGIHSFIDVDELRGRYDRIIFYDLEHTSRTRMPWICDEWLDTVDEIWTPWLENDCFQYGRNHDKVRFMPMRATKFLRERHVGSSEVSYRNDWCFFGTLTPYRREILEGLNLRGKSYQNRNQFSDLDFLKETKFVLDLPQSEGRTFWSQNVVRIFEAVCLGKSVVSSESSYNYYGDAVIEVGDLRCLEDVIKSSYPVDRSDEFWDETYADADYDKYRENLKKNYEKKEIER